MTTSTLWLARHGESTANVAASAAEAAGALTIDVDVRDADVPLSGTGAHQAEALGGWLAQQDEPPASVWCSPYLRALDTARIALGRAGLDRPLLVDERLRDRELGVLDLLTSRGVEERHPDEARRRARLGRYAYRPPGGESWMDVALRLRTLLPAIVDSPGGVLVVAHDVIVTLLVAICCGMTERQLLELASGHAVGNASLTTLVRDGADGDAPTRAWRLESYGGTAHLDDAGAPTTTHTTRTTPTTPAGPGPGPGPEPARDRDHEGSSR